MRPDRGERSASTDRLGRQCPAARQPASPVASAEPTETVTLIPMGCARLRLSAFPLISRADK